MPGASYLNSIIFQTGVLFFRTFVQSEAPVLLYDFYLLSEFPVTSLNISIGLI